MRFAETVSTTLAVDDHLMLQLSALPVGIIALVSFGVLALITVSYRNVAHRQYDKGSAAGAEVERTRGH